MNRVKAAPHFDLLVGWLLGWGCFVLYGWSSGSINCIGGKLLLSGGTRFMLEFISYSPVCQMGTINWIIMALLWFIGWLSVHFLPPPWTFHVLERLTASVVSELSDDGWLMYSWLESFKVYCLGALVTRPERFNWLSLLSWPWYLLSFPPHLSRLWSPLKRYATPSVIQHLQSTWLQQISNP